MAGRNVVDQEAAGHPSTVTIDTTVSQVIKGSGQWGVASAANILKVQTGTIKRVE